MMLPSRAPFPNGVRSPRRSVADNIWFEQRVSAARQAAFEAEAIGAAEPTSLRKAHADYWSEFMRVDAGDVPQTFDSALAPADLGAIDEMQKIVRIEGLDRALNKHGMTFERLRRAVTNGETAVVDGFLARPIQQRSATGRVLALKKTSRGVR
jgi:hypothetical protein